MVTAPGIGMNVTCKNDIKINANGAKTPVELTHSCICSLFRFVTPKWRKSKYIISTKNAITNADIPILIMDFLLLIHTFPLIISLPQKSVNKPLPKPKKSDYPTFFIKEFLC